MIIHPDLRAVNGPQSEVVGPQNGEGTVAVDGRVKARISPLSYRMIRLEAKHVGSD